MYSIREICSQSLKALSQRIPDRTGLVAGAGGKFLRLTWEAHGKSILAPRLGGPLDFMGPSRIAGIWIVKIYRGSFVEAVPAKGAVA